jgi:hypothetical protein
MGNRQKSIKLENVFGIGKDFSGQLATGKRVLDSKMLLGLERLLGSTGNKQLANQS